MKTKGIISGLKRMEIHDGDGLRTTVFFKGCPLKCLWCHNPESISKKPQLAHFFEKCISCGSCVAVCPNSAITFNQRELCVDENKCILCGKCESECPSLAINIFGKEYDVDTLVEMLLADKPFFDNSGGGVTLSGGECLYQADFAVQVAKELFERSVSVNVDTCGFVSRKVLERIMPYTDTFLYDIKAIDSNLHKKLTGVDNSVILENLTFLIQSGAKIEIRFPLVQGVNSEEAEKIGEFLSKFNAPPKIKVLQYHSLAGSRYQALRMENTLPKVTTTISDVQNAVNTLKSFNLLAINGTSEK